MLGRLKSSDFLRTAVIVIGLALLLAAAWRAFDWFNDRQAIGRDRAGAAAVVGRRQVESERSARVARDARDAAAGNQQRELEEKGDAALRDGRSPWDAVANEL